MQGPSFRNVRSISLDLVLATVLFIAAAMTVLPVFSGDYGNNWGSIESAFISDAKFIAANWPNLGWYPYWYGGMPFHTSYPPILPYAVALISLLTSWSIGHSYRVLTGLSYAAAPVALYVLALVLSKRRSLALVAGVTYMSVPTFLLGMAPSHVDIFAVYGEGPHTLAIPFLLLGVAQLARCMENPTRFRYVTAALLAAVVALVDVVPLFAFALAAMIILFGELRRGNFMNSAGVFLKVTIIAYGLAAFQYTSDFLFKSAAATSADMQMWALPLLFMGVVVLTFIIVNRTGTTGTLFRTAFTAMGWAVLFGSIQITSYLLNVSLAPQPVRYVPESDLGTSMLVGLIAVSAIDYVAKAMRGLNPPSRMRVKNVLVACTLLVLLLSAIFLFAPNSYRQTAQEPRPLSTVPEYNIASWLSTHVNNNESVFATGSVGFWLDVFSNAREIRGGSDQGVTNRWTADITYQILVGDNATIAVALMRAFGVRYVVVTFPNATTTYYDYHYPDKFNGVLPLRYSYEGYGIYEVPSSGQPGMVSAVDARVMQTLPQVTGVLDLAHISAYVNAVESGPTGVTVTYTTPDPDRIQITVNNATTDTAILVKTTYDARWSTSVNTSAEQFQIQPNRAGPDFMLLYPTTRGS